MLTNIHLEQYLTEINYVSYSKNVTSGDRLSIDQSYSEDQNFVTDSPAAEKARSVSEDEVGRLFSRVHATL